MKQILLVLLTLFVTSAGIAQSTKTHIQGRLLNESGSAVAYASVTTKQQSVLSNEKGYYSIEINTRDSVTLYITAIGYTSIEKTFYAKTPEAISFSPILKQNVVDIPKIHVIYNKQQEENITYLTGEKAIGLTGLSLSGIEGSIKTLAGVSSKSELSSQYSVRGGSYDENLVYVNGIQAFKPSMTRSDKQEGLSIINPYMVGSIEFSSGGFGPQYGDKMSSVLVVNYKNITENSVQFDASFMDANITAQGVYDSLGVSYIAGMRYKNTSFLLQTLDDSGSISPAFYDLQTLVSYSISKKLNISYWLYGANNTYNFVPETRVTDFGGLFKKIRMQVYFDGKESYIYQNIGNALSLSYTPKDRTFLHFNALHYLSSESETFDVLAQYRLGEVVNEDEDNNLFQRDSSDLYAVGSFLEHGRNYLHTHTIVASHSGKQIWNPFTLSWGASLTHSIYDAQFNEWTYIDSANYALPYNDTAILLANVKNADIQHTQTLAAAYWNIAKRFYFANNARSTIRGNIGIRTTYDTYTQKTLYNPRVSFILKPRATKNITYSFASGIYHQPPQFKELIDKNGVFYNTIAAQTAIHYVLGMSRAFLLWQRPFIYHTELYYKQLHNIIPYTSQNVSSVYYPNLTAKGYTTGLDTKINGEFVPGVESWISISLMQSKEYLIENPQKKIRRPNDQLLNFGLFFQDYVPGSEHIKMNLTYHFGSNIPIATPKADYYSFDNHQLPMYNRIDLGFLMLIQRKQIQNTKKQRIESMWLGAEIFNVFDNANKISYFWIEDVNGNYHSIPNYLTSRRLNVKLSIKI